MSILMLLKRSKYAEARTAMMELGRSAAWSMMLPPPGGDSGMGQMMLPGTTEAAKQRRWSRIRSR
jgi:hypothetical protein